MKLCPAPYARDIHYPGLLLSALTELNEASKKGQPADLSRVQRHDPRIQNSHHYVAGRQTPPLQLREQDIDWWKTQGNLNP